jgi:hypothetical protein
MSDCLHCDIHEMLESHPQGKEADLAEVAANVCRTPKSRSPCRELQAMLMAGLDLGGMLLQKSQEDADPTSPRRRH